MIKRFILETKIRKFTNSQLDLVLDPDSKVLSISLVIVPAKFNFIINLRIVDNTFALQKLLVEFFTDIKLDRVVTSSDSLNIPFDKVVGLDTSDVVDVNNHKESNEYTNTSIVKSMNLSLRNFFISVNARHLDKQHCTVSYAFIIVSVNVAGQVTDGATLLLVTPCCNFLTKTGVNEAGAFIRIIKTILTVVLFLLTVVNDTVSENFSIIIVGSSGGA